MKNENKLVNLTQNSVDGNQKSQVFPTTGPVGIDGARSNPS